MAESSEQVILEDGNIKITNLRAILDGKTYSVSNITSVGLSRQEANGCFPTGLLLVGIALVLLNLAGSKGPDWGLVITGAILAGVGILGLRSLRPPFIVQVGSASGEIKALITPNEELAKKVVAAINDAIVKKG